MKNFNHNYPFPAGELSALLRKARPYQDRITTDKRLRFASPKLPSATFFIRKPLYDIPPLHRIRKHKNTGIIVNYGG
jgi:hypothetical protein